jgi:hypothetical protein
VTTRLDLNEAEVMRAILLAVLDGELPTMRTGDWGIARSLLHRLNRVLEGPPPLEVEEEVSGG